MSKEIDSNRRAVLKKGAVLSTALSGAGLISGSVAAASYDYKLVVEAVNGSGSFTGDWDNLEIVDQENIESSDSVSDELIYLWVDDTFAPYKDIVYFNADDIEPTTKKIDSSWAIDVTVTGNGETLDLA